MNLGSDNKNKSSAGSAPKILSFIMLVLVVVLIAFMVYMKSNNKDIKNMSLNEVIKGSFFIKGSDTANFDSVQIEYNPKDHPLFAVYKGYIVKCIDDNVKFIDKNGTTIWDKTLAVNDPIIKTNGIELLIVGTGSKEIFLLKDREVKWSYKFDSNILNAELSDSGHVAVVHEAKGFKGAVTVFNLQGVPLFTRNIAEGFVISAGVSNKAKAVAINSLETGGVKTVSSIELTDTLGKPIAPKIHFEDVLFPAVWYLKDDALAAVSDSKVVYLSSDGKTKWEAPMGEGSILGSDKLDNKEVVIAVEGVSGNAFSGNTTKILTINADGKQNELYSLEGTAKNITVKDDIVAVNTGSKVSFINSRGKILGKYTSKIDINEVKFLSKDEAVVITKNSIDIIQVKN